MQEYMQEFIRKLEDDFNTPEALSVFFLLNKFVNTNIRDNFFSLEELQSLIDFYKTLNEVLAIIDFDLSTEKQEIKDEFLQKLEERNIAKKEKNFELADSIRDELLKN
jgi:cysteinyl-tRNA synthetase